VDFSCFGYHPDLESRLTIQEKWVLERGGGKNVPDPQKIGPEDGKKTTHL
jgi:hypothetical protein